MRFVCTPVDTTAEPDNSGLPAKPKERIRMGTKLIPGRRPELVLGAGQKVKRGWAGGKWGVGQQVSSLAKGWVILFFSRWWWGGS